MAFLPRWPVHHGPTRASRGVIAIADGVFSSQERTMRDLVVIASPNASAASVGAVLDAHAALGSLYASNRPLSDYSQMATGVRLVTPDGGPVRLAGGRSLPSDGGLPSVVEPRLAYLAAFEPGEPPETALAQADPVLLDWLVERHARGAVIAAAGAAVWRLAQAGLLDGQAVCIEPRLAPAFRQAFPRLAIEAVQPMSPAAPVMTCALLAFERAFVARAFDQAVSPSVGAWLRMRWGDLPDSAGSTPVDPLVGQAQLWIRERFTDRFRIQDLAVSLSVSHQTLIRRFRQVAGVTPREYAQGLRIQAARSMLRETGRTVSEVAALVGYADAPTFRAVFRAHVGHTPAEERAQARRPG
jgi:transcriptional regulator GlxA family with amidase domain